MGFKTFGNSDTMRIFSKLLGNRGQISIEFGLLVFAVVVAATVISYYHIQSIKASGKVANRTAISVVEKYDSAVSSFVDSVKNLSN